GTGDWSLFHPGKAAGVLPIAGLNLALSEVKLNAEDAILGDLQGKSLGLYVRNPGRQTVVFNWTARGDSRPEGLYFSLKMPPCVKMSLEIALPRDHLLLWRNGPALPPPQRNGDAQTLLWSLSFSGWSQIDLEVRRFRGTDLPPPAVLWGM